MPRSTKAKDEPADPSGQAGQRVGMPGKTPHHDGGAGSGEMRDLGNRKWNKESRDSALEKEGGKSRGAGG